MAVQQLLAAYAVAGGGGGDPDFSSRVSLLHFDGANGSTTFTDVKGKTWTRSGPSGPSISTTDPKFGTGCLLISDGNIYTADSADFHFGSGDFCIEVWARPDNTFQTGAIASQWDGGSSRSWVLYQVGANIQFSYSTDGPTQTNAVSASAGWSTAAYQFLEVSCVSGVIRVFVNGTQVGSNHARVGALFNSAQNVLIGDNATGGAQWNGRLDDLRISKGVGGNTANYTPPTAPFPDS